MIISGFGPKNVHLEIPIGFLFTFWLISKQTADWLKICEGIKWPAIDGQRFGVHRISVRSMVTELQAKRCFVNKQLTYSKNFEHTLFWQLFFNPLCQMNILRKFGQNWMIICWDNCISLVLKHDSTYQVQRYVCDKIGQRYGIEFHFTFFFVQ